MRLDQSTSERNPQRPVFSTRTDAVRVDVRVTERGKAVPGLQVEDFEVRDNGVVQQVGLASGLEVPLDVVLAFDLSASLSRERLEHLRRAGRGLLDALNEDDQAALVTFSHVVSGRHGLTRDHGRIRAILEQAEPDGDTALIDGVYVAMTVGDSVPGRALVMVFSDGLDISSWLTPQRVIQAAKSSDAVVYAVWTGGSSTSAFLRDLTETTGGELLAVESSAGLGAIFVRMLNDFRLGYALTFSPAGVALDGWHRLEVRVKRRNVAVMARRGYWR